MVPFPAAGLAVDMAQPGALAECLAGLTGGELQRRGQNARAWVQAQFSKDVVIGQYVRMYEAVVGVRQ